MAWPLLLLAPILSALVHVGAVVGQVGISAISSIARGMLGKKADPVEGEPTPTPGAPPTKEEAPFRPMDWILGKGPTGGTIDPAKVTPLATAPGGDMDAQAILAALMGLDARATSIATIVAAQSNFLARIEALTRGVSGGARVEEATEDRLDKKKTAAAKSKVGFWKGLRKTAMKSLLPLAGLYALASWIQGGKDIAKEDMGPIEGKLTEWGGKLLSMLTGGAAGFAEGGQYSGTIESFAGGGQAGGMALVGEKGPELVDYFGPGGETIVNQPTLISRAAHVKPLGGPNMGFGSGQMQMAAGGGMLRLPTRPMSGYRGGGPTLPGGGPTVPSGGMTRLPTRPMSGYRGGGMTSLPARPMKAYASGGMFTDQAQLGDSKFVVSQAKRRDRFSAGLKAVSAGYRKRRESIAGAMAGGENPLQAGLAMEETGSEFARGFYAPRAILDETFRRSLGKKGIFPGSEMYISMQESKANTAIKSAGEDDYGNIDMGDTQFEAPTPRQERDLFKQIMQGDIIMKPQDVEAYMAISPRIKEAVDAQMKAGNIPPALRVTTMRKKDWVTGHKLESDRVAEFKARGEAGTLPTKFYREGVGRGGRGDTQKEYDRLKREGYVYNKYGEWQLPAWGEYADMARGRSYSTTEEEYIDVDDGERSISETSWEKTKLSTYGKYQGKEGRGTLFGGQTTGYLGRNAIPTYKGGTPSQDYGQNLLMNPIAREKFDKFFGLDNIKWGEPIVYGTPDDKILPAAEAIVNIARQEVVTGMSVTNQRLKKQVTERIEINAPATTVTRTTNHTTYTESVDNAGLPDIPGSYGARAM